MRIAVTGASGFIGGAAATALAADGHEVVGFGRRSDAWAHPRGEYRRWDLVSGAPPADAGGFAAVVHCAGLADDAASVDEAVRVNVGGAARVRDAFPRARVVHLSSSSIYDLRHASVQVREEEGPARRHLNGYGLSKALAEDVWAGRDAVILRPHAVYGPGDTTLLPRIEAAIRRGRLALPRGGRARHALTHIDNLVAAVRAGLDGRPGVYNVTDAEPVELRELLTAALRARGREVRVVAVPLGVAVVAGATAEAAGRALRRPVPLTRYRVAQLGYERTYDLARARTGLGYTPAAPTLDGVADW